MDEVLSLEKEHSFLKKKLEKNLNKKHFIQAAINNQFEKLKKLEISLEKMRVNHDNSLSMVRYAIMKEQLES